MCSTSSHGRTLNSYLVGTFGNKMTTTWFFYEGEFLPSLCELANRMVFSLIYTSIVVNMRRVETRVGHRVLLFVV